MSFNNGIQCQCSERISKINLIKINQEETNVKSNKSHKSFERLRIEIFKTCKIIHGINKNVESALMRVNRDHEMMITSYSSEKNYLPLIILAKLTTKSVYDVTCTRILYTME